MSEILGVSINSFINLVKDEPFLLLFVPVLLIVVLLFKAKSIVNFIDERKKSKLTNISNALECEHIDGVTKACLQNEINAEHFYLSTGIRVEKQLREAIIKSHSDTKGKLSLLIYKKALKYLTFKEDGQPLKVNLKKYDYFANLLMSIFFLLVGTIGFFLLLGSFILAINDDVFKVQYLAISGTGLLYMFLACLMLYQMDSFLSARKIKAELENEVESNSKCFSKFFSK